MAAISTHSHSFSPHLAAEYGIEEAILINYFQHWITKNRARERHFYDDRTWMYETQEDMAANFLYMNHFKVFRTIKSLIKKGVLKSGNYNKNRYDQTGWYAFVDEEKFIGGSGRLQKCKMEIAGSQNRDCENATPIPVTIPITNTYKEKEINKEKIGGKPPDPLSASPPHSPSAQDLFSLFLSKIKEKNPNFKEPNANTWLKQFDLLLRVDKRDFEEVKQLISWASQHEFWSSTCLSPSNLRRSYDRMLMQMKKKPTSSSASNAPSDYNTKTNKEYLSYVEELYPDKIHSLTVTDKYVAKPGTGNDVYFHVAPETFRMVLFNLIGVSDEG